MPSDATASRIYKSQGNIIIIWNTGDSNILRHLQYREITILLKGTHYTNETQIRP